MIRAEGADFTFRRVKPPQGGQGISFVQIDPAEQLRLLGVPAARPDAKREVVARPQGQSRGLFDWYWAEVSPRIEDRAHRFPKALEMLSRGPGVAAPRMQALQEMAERHGTALLRATVGTNVSPALALAVMGVESTGRADAVSHAGAVGLMQLIPATAARFGVRDSRDPAENIRGGVAYLDWLMREFDGDPVLVLAGYNAGEGAVKSAGGVPNYAETRAYVPKVLAAWQVAQGLCLTPPELVSDPCVFKVIAAGG